MYPEHFTVNRLANTLYSMTPETQLYRQVFPGERFIRNGKISSQVFTPKPSDNNQLSVFDGDKISAQESFESFNTVQQANSTTGSLSIGVVAVKVADCQACTECDRPLDVREDPNNDFEEHAVIDFSSCPSKRKIRVAARHLKYCAEQHYPDSAGFAYRP